MNLSVMLERVRYDLHDEDPAGRRWSDAELERHIGHALRDLSLALPLQARAALVASPGSRDLSLAALAGLVNVEAVEYPAGLYPPSYVPFSIWGSALTMLIDAAPAGDEPVNVYYGMMHSLDAVSSTIPGYLEEAVATGASAYAALEWAGFAANRVNVGGEEVWRRYLTWGQAHLNAFSGALAGLGRRSALRVGRLYTPAGPDTRPG